MQLVLFLWIRKYTIYIVIRVNSLRVIVISSGPLFTIVNCLIPSMSWGCNSLPLYATHSPFFPPNNFSKWLKCPCLQLLSLHNPLLSSVCCPPVCYHSLPMRHSGSSSAIAPCPLSACVRAMPPVVRACTLPLLVNHRMPLHRARLPSERACCYCSTVAPCPLLHARPLLVVNHPPAHHRIVPHCCSPTRTPLRHAAMPSSRSSAPTEHGWRQGLKNQNSTDFQNW
jgi:hypothetical protein